MTFLQKLQSHASEIEDWYNSFIFDEDSDFVYFPLRMKVIKNPIYERQDLLTLDFFNDPQIRTIVSIDFFQGTVINHNHKDTSYFVLDQNTKFPQYFPVEENVFYKSTHFTITSNNSAYLNYNDEKIFWEKNVFNEMNLLEVDHSAVNKEKTPVKFIYFDYYA